MSPRKANDDKCMDCRYDLKSALGTWRQQVESCPCSQCPLYENRLRKRASRSLSKALWDKSALLFDSGVHCE